jgi:hypothetical protein
MKILYNSEKIKRIVDEPPLVSYKRDENIKDKLVHGKHNLQFDGKENGCRACGKNCALCSHIIESTSFKDSEGNKGRSPSNGKLSDFSFYIDSQKSAHRKFKK